MTSVQVRRSLSRLLHLAPTKLTLVSRPQNVFIMDGDSVRAELERRKFTVEEGDHLMALNAYNAFVKCTSSLPFICVRAQ